MERGAKAPWRSLASLVVLMLPLLVTVPTRGETDCTAGLGLEDGSVPDQSIT